MVCGSYSEEGDQHVGKLHVDASAESMSLVFLPRIFSWPVSTHVGMKERFNFKTSLLKLGLTPEQHSTLNLLTEHFIAERHIVLST